MLYQNIRREWGTLASLGSLRLRSSHLPPGYIPTTTVPFLGLGMPSSNHIERKILRLPPLL
jgi:hypothetical protein